MSEREGQLLGILRAFIDLQRAQLDLEREQGEMIMGALADLQTAVGELSDLITTQVIPVLGSGGSDDAALEAIADQVDNLAEEIRAALPATSTATAPATSTGTAPATSTSTASASSSASASAPAPASRAARRASRPAAPVSDGVFRG